MPHFSAVPLTVALALIALQGLAAPQTFDGADTLKIFTLTGEASLDFAKNRGGHKGLEDETADAQPVAGGALRLDPQSLAVLPLAEQDGTGTVELWVFEDGAVPANAKAPAAGALWGLQRSDGYTLAVGPVYADYLNGAATYAAAYWTPGAAVNGNPWQMVTYLGIRRQPGWHKWTFEFAPDQGLRLRYDDQVVKLFNWDLTDLTGFSRLVFMGDRSGAGQTLWVDDLTVTLGPPAVVRPKGPPPPPPPLPFPDELATVLPPQAPWNATPYTKWQRGPDAGEDYFPIAVWLQQPKNAARFQAAGINLYIGLWEGPTAAQMAALQEVNMPVICMPNEYGLANRDNPLFVAWMQRDEPDNAQKFDTYWQGDKERIKEGWPELYDSLKLATQPYRGFGPPVPPSWIVREYERVTAADPTRPVFLGLGQGVAWPKWHGRGERTGKLDDYPKYIEGCDIVCYDIYPKAEGAAELATALWHVPLGVRRLRQWCQDAKPVWVHIETGVINHPGSKPTPADVRAEVWMALIHGARGIDYFVHQFKPTFNEHALLDDAEMLAAVTALNQQITRLARVLNSPTIADGVAVTGTTATAPVHAMVKHHGGAIYLFAAAMTLNPVKPTFTLVGLPDGAIVEVLDEGRQLPLRNGAFTDDFAGHAVHLYRIARP